MRPIRTSHDANFMQGGEGGRAGERAAFKKSTNTTTKNHGAKVDIMEQATISLEACENMS